MSSSLLGCLESRGEGVGSSFLGCLESCCGYQHAHSLILGTRVSCVHCEFKIQVGEGLKMEVSCLLVLYSL